METLVNFSQSLIVHVGINLGGGDVGMSEKLLNDPEVCTVLEQMSGKGVAQEVGIHVLFNAGLPGTFLDDLSNAVGTEWPTSHGEEDFRRSVWLHEFRTLVGEIGFEGRSGARAHWDDAGFVSLAGDPHESIVEVEGLQPGGAYFGEAQPGRIEKFQDGQVPAAKGPGRIYRIQEFFHLGAVQGLREVAASTRGEEGLGWIRCD